MKRFQDRQIEGIATAAVFNSRVHTQQNIPTVRLLSVQILFFRCACTWAAIFPMFYLAGLYLSS
jgi:hypothetical protein